MANETPVVDLNIGVTGLKHSGGVIFEEYNKSLAGAKAAAVYKEMRDNNAVIGAVLFVIESILSQASYKVVKGEGKGARRAVTLLKDILDDMDAPFANVVADATSMLQFGWYLGEKVYKKRTDGLFGLQEIGFRAQETLNDWTIDVHGHVHQFNQCDPNTMDIYNIPLEKCLHITTTSRKQNPEGRSVLRSAYRSYFFGKRLEEIEAIGIERDLAGLPVVEMPLDMLSSDAPAGAQAQVARFKKMVQSIRRDEQEGVLFPAETGKDGKPTGYKLRLLTTGGSRAINVNEPIRRYDTRIAMSLLAQFILLGTEKSGSFALADRQASIFTIALQMFLNKICDALQKQVINPLMTFNGFDKKEIPKLKFEQLDDISMTSLATFINQLVASNVITPDDMLEDHLREWADLPERDESTVRATATNPMGAGRPVGGASSDGKARNTRELNNQDPAQAENKANVRTQPEQLNVK